MIIIEGCRYTTEIASMYVQIMCRVQERARCVMEDTEGPFIEVVAIADFR